MALHYTKKHDNSEDDALAEDFINLLLESRRHPDQRRQDDNIEATE